MATKKTAKVKKMDGLSADVRQEKLDTLKQLVPEAFADGKIDVKRLQKLVGEDVVTEDERYRLEWSGKAEIFDEIAERSSCTLTLDKKRSSKDWKESNNIFIEGENLEVLRTLQKAYSGKVKMIYIDPPYNTGHDFVYNDNFRETEEEYCDDECNVDENGLLKKAYKLNSRDSGRFHSNWMSMIYPRLYLARNLLRDDGVIFVSIDDNEVHNLRMIMNEIFGEENFIDSIVWKKTENIKMDSRFLSQNKDYVICFRKSPSVSEFQKELSDINRFNLKDEKGLYYLRKLDSKSSAYRKTLDYVIEHDGIKYYPGGSKENWELRQKEDVSGFAPRWLWSKKKFEKGLVDGDIIFRNGKVYNKVRYDEIAKKPFVNIQSLASGQTAQKELDVLFSGKRFFDHPKPPQLVEWLIGLVCEDKNSLVLDFFSGSGTTAHAVMNMNANDNGTRKFINVQMPEETPDGSAALKAGYKKISDIAIDRIKKAATKIKKDHPKFKGDLGVRVYKETESHFPQWHSQVFKSDKDLEQAIIDYSKAVPSGTPYDRATEVLLKLGYPLTTTIVEKDGYMMATDEVALVLDTKFPVKNLQKVIDASPKTIVVLEKLFKKDEEKINFALRCKEANVIFQTV